MSNENKNKILEQYKQALIQQAVGGINARLIEQRIRLDNGNDNSESPINKESATMTEVSLLELLEAKPSEKCENKVVAPAKQKKASSRKSTSNRDDS